MRLISDEVISKYLMNTRTVAGKTYNVSLDYTGESKDELGEVLADIYHVRFSAEGNIHEGRLIIPSLREDGLLLRNKSVWYPVTMLIPPLKYHTVSSLDRHFHSVISLKSSAGSVSEFMPTEMTTGITPYTPLMKELMPKKSLDARNLWNWNALRLDVLIVEMINYKITDDIAKSRKGGFLGISATVKSVHTLINAILRYKEGMTEWGASDEQEESCGEDIEELGRISVEDVTSVVVLHDLVCSIEIEENGPVDFCTCSPSIPMRTARLRDGVTVEECRMKGDPTFPYTKWRRAIPGVLSDDPRRVIVSKSITRAMTLSSPTEPLTMLDVRLNVDSVSLPGVRMTHPLTNSDGIVVSRTMSEMMGAYKIYIDKFMVSNTAEVMILKDCSDHPDIRKYARDVSRAAERGNPIEARHVVKRGDVIANILYVDETSTQIVEQHKSRAKSPAVVMKIDSFVPETDMEEKGVMYRVISIAYLPLNVGDKLADAHGNKGTVSAIIDDKYMPVVDGSITAHYMAYPFVGKRLPVGAEIEDKLAILNKNKIDEAVANGSAEADRYEISSSDIISLSDVNEVMNDEGIRYRYDVELDGKCYSNVPLSYRMMFRLDNNSIETLSTKTEHVVRTGRRHSNNVIMGLDLVTMLTRGAKALVDWLITESHSGEMMMANVIPALYAISGTYPEGAPTYVIDKTIDRAMLGKVFRTERIAEEDFNGTVCDLRAETHYGIIRMGHKVIVVPPHKPVYQVNYGHSMVDTVSKLANRVYAEYKSSRTEYREFTDVETQVRRYNDALCGHILGKDSIFRTSLLPVFPTTDRAVASPYIGSSPFEIAIPRVSFNKLYALSEEFRLIYRLKENHICLLKRDPVHRPNNVIAVKFVLWDNPTIGIFPPLMEGMDGDFDGDSVFGLFPTNFDAHQDLYKLIPDMSYLKMSKHLSDTDAHNAMGVISSLTGEPSSFEMLHPLDIPKNATLFEKLMAGISEKDLAAETMKAAKDFFTIKDGTARTGALGLTFIFTRSPEKKHILKDAMELYHVLAQNTLDAKSGAKLPALQVVSGAMTGDMNLVNAGLDELGFFREECRAEFAEFIEQMQKEGGRAKFMSKCSPVFGCMQKSPTVASAQVLSRRYLNGEVSGIGVYDGLFDYVTGRLSTSPFQWIEKEDVLTRRMDIFVNKLKDKFEGGF